ncbi:MAG: cyclase family protein [Dehalococcoidia bacterium]|nr:cyclase family protein [Dehalococcoidia bacterium]
MKTRTPPSRREYEAYKVRFCNWGRWGPDDELGTLNFITEDVRRAAVALVRDGRTVSLARPLATAGVLAGARNPRPATLELQVDERGSGDAIGVAYHGFANTHIDALCHIFADGGRAYNDRPASDVGADGARSNAIEGWRSGIVTRGVLYDVPRHRGVAHVSFDEPVHGWELADIAEAEQIAPRAGDAVIVRAGSDAFWARHPTFEPPWRAPGLHASVLEFLYDTNAALLGWDLMEAPGQDEYRAPALPIHSIAIPYMGLPLLDNTALEELAAACSDAGRREFLLIVAPLVVIGGTGSLVNPIAML